MMTSKELLGDIASVLTFVAFGPYLFASLRGKVRPHFFSWLIWSLTTLIVFAAQLSAHGGSGAWSIGWGGVLTVIIATIAFVKKSNLSVHRSDWVFLFVAMGSIPLWFFTSNPLFSVLLLTGIDLLGFGPTIRNAWKNPHQEQITFYGLYVLRNIFSFYALESYSITTWFFPIVIGLACIPLIGVIFLRRHPYWFKSSGNIR